jgi:hypothetical protein
VLELAWQSVRRLPRRFAASAGAVSSGVMLVLTAVGLYLGLLDAVARWPGSLPGDFVISEAGGSSTLLHTSSSLAPERVEAVRATPGISGLHPLHGRLAWLERDGRDALVFLVGVDRRGTFGGPVAMLAGRRVPRIDEIVIDRVLAHDLRVGLGERLRIGPALLRVGGIADGGNAVLGSYAFVSLGTLQAGGVTEPSFLFAGLSDGEDAGAVRARLEALPGLRVRSRTEFLAQNQSLARQLLLPLITILAAITAVVSGAIVALVLYTTAVEHRTDWGLLSAVGMPTRRLLGTVVLQALLATGTGVLLGLLAGRLLGAAIPAVEPRFVTIMPVWLDAAVATAAVAIGLTASVASVRAVAAVDPGSVFRA